jgi:transposase InsO family protein
MSVHDAVVEYRKQLVAVIDASPNKRAACAEAGIHPSTFYRWRNRDFEASPLRSWRQRYLEERVLRVALAAPQWGPVPVRDELRDQGVEVSASTVWRILVRHQLNTRVLRRRLLSQHRAPSTIEIVARPDRAPIGRLDAEVPGDLVQFDCFHVGSFKETRLKAGKQTRGHIWQYTAIDVASSWLWVELHATTRNPTPALTSALAHRVAVDLTRFGWEWKAATTDNGNEFVAHQFTTTLDTLGVTHRRIKAGRPQSNGKVERVQRTLLEELYQPALIGYIEPSITGLRRDLDAYVTYYNWKRRHYGKWNQGATPADIMIPNPKLHP